MVKISIIIPVYNAEKHIEKCLNSIKGQKETKNKFEVIIVNDGSTDNSEEVIKKYIENSELDIKYYGKENEGVAKTRNYGIRKSTGDYILFIDADDYIAQNTLSILEPYLEKNVDLIKFKLQRVDNDGNIIEKVDGPVFKDSTGEEAFNRLYCEDILLDSPCVYLIKKDLFTKNNLEFQGTYHEDFGLMPTLILSAKRMVSLPDYLYQYVQAGNSITRNDDYGKTIKKMEDCLFHYDRMLKLIDNMKLRKETKENIKIYYTNAIILKLQELNKEDRNRYIKEIKKRKMQNNIKARGLKQSIKKIILKININLYLKMR